MSNIDLYIEKSKFMDGGKYSTKAYPFREEGLILVKKMEVDFEKLKKIIRKCKEKGVNIPLYIDYKFDGENYWILEELALGDELISLALADNRTQFFSNIPYQHIEKYFRDVYILEKNGIGVEPAWRNIFYDKKKGFTTIDVALLEEEEKQDSLYAVNHFFQMLYPVCLTQFSDDEYGHLTRKKIMLNMIKAFENAHPFFKKYERWICRGNEEFSLLLESQGVDLTLDEEESKILVNLIEELIDSIVEERIQNPNNFFSLNATYVDLLKSSIIHCPQFSLFNIKEQTLEKYIEVGVNNKIKSCFFKNVNDMDLRKLYFKIREKELNPFWIYPEEEITEQIKEEIKILMKKI